MKRILFVADAIPPHELGGIPNVTWNQAAELSKRNEVGIIINSVDVKNEVKISKIGEITVFTLPRMFPNWMRVSYHYQNFSNKTALLNVLSQFRPDIFHINGYFNLDARDFRVLLKSPVRVVREVCYPDDLCMKGNLMDGNNEHCTGPSPEKCRKCYFDSYQTASNNFLKRGIKQITTPWLLKKQDALVKQLFGDVFAGVVFPSRGLKDLFERSVRIENKAIVIPHGVDIPRNVKEAPETGARQHITFGYIGSLRFTKGIDVVLEAFNKLISRNATGFKILVWGTATEEKYFRELAELENKYPELISYKGEYTPDDIPEISKIVDVGIVPSYTETYCLVLREWLSQGVPVVTTDYFGSEIIENDRNGYIIPVGDAEELSRKIQKISNEPETIKRLVRGAGETYIPTVADECLALESFYEKLSPAAAVAASAAPAGDSRQ